MTVSVTTAMRVCVPRSTVASPDGEMVPMIAGPFQLWPPSSDVHA